MCSQTVLNDPLPLSAEAIDALRTKFEAVFARNVASKVKDKRQISKLALNPSLVECFLTLDPTCRDEEIEDLVYFMLDLYQFNGIPVAAHDIDVDTVVVDLRALLEECAAKVKSARRANAEDDRQRHLFLVLDKNVQGMPWESIPVLRGRAVSRIPSIAFLMDRLQLSRTLTASTPSQKQRKPVVTDRALVNPAKTTYILNPSGDLKSTEQTFAPWVKGMDKEVGWDGIIGRAPAELEMVNALTKKDLVMCVLHNRRVLVLISSAAISGMVVPSSTCARTRFGTCLAARRPCSGDAPPAQCARWASLTGRARQTATC